MLKGSRTPPTAEDRTLRRRRTRRRRGTRRVCVYMMRGWGVMGLLQDPHPYTDLGVATSFALL
jgi:hypothetical protein